MTAKEAGQYILDQYKIGSVFYIKFNDYFEYDTFKLHVLPKSNKIRERKINELYYEYRILSPDDIKDKKISLCWILFYITFVITVLTLSYNVGFSFFALMLLTVIITTLLIVLFILLLNN